MDLFQNLPECLEKLHQSQWQLELTLQSQTISKTRSVPHGYINIKHSKCIRALVLDRRHPSFVTEFGRKQLEGNLHKFPILFFFNKAKLCCQVINKGLPKYSPGEIIPNFRLLGLSLINKGLLESFLCSIRGFRQPVGLTVNSLEDIAPTVCLAMLNAEPFTGGPLKFSFPLRFRNAWSHYRKLAALMPRLFFIYWNNLL